MHQFVWSGPTRSVIRLQSIPSAYAQINTLLCMSVFAHQYRLSLSFPQATDSSCHKTEVVPTCGEQQSCDQVR